MKYFLLLFFIFVSVSAAAESADSKLKVTAYDALLSNYNYPFEVNFLNISSQGKTLKMAYMFLPGDKNKPVVTLLHGKNFNGAYWEQTAKLLNSKGYNVLMPDQIGFGKSSKPTDYQYSFSALALNTKSLLAHLKVERSIIIGHSMGGMLASRFALNHSENTTKLILINSIGLENYLRYVEYKDIDFFYQSELKKTPEKIIAYQRKNYYDGAWNSSYEALTLPLSGWTQGPDRKLIAYVNALTYDMIFNQPVIEELKYLTVPTAVILGTRDRTGPGRNWKKAGTDYQLGRFDQLGQQLKHRNSDLNIVDLEGLGHLPQIENFSRFKDSLLSTLSLN